MITSNYAQPYMGNYHHYVNAVSNSAPVKKEAVAPAPAVAVQEPFKQEKLELELKREQLQRDEQARNTRKVFDRMDSENERNCSLSKTIT